MRQKYVQIENKNALLELLKEGKKFYKLFIAQNAYKDAKTTEIMNEATARHVPIELMSRRNINRRTKTSSYESILGLMETENQVNLETLLADIYSKNDVPFFVIFDDVRYMQNVAAILRTSYAGFVNGIITPIKKDNFLNDEVTRISMGASLRIPIVEMNLFDAIKKLQKDGVRVIALDMEGESFFNADLTGPIAFVVGAEDIGVTGKILERCDEILSIPMREGIGSLNVSASAAVMVFEKIRQEAAKVSSEIIN